MVDPAPTVVVVQRPGQTVAVAHADEVSTLINVVELTPSVLSLRFGFLSASRRFAGHRGGDLVEDIEHTCIGLSLIHI